MISTKDQLIKKVPCVCFELPCVHNPEVSEDIKITVSITGVVSKKGLKYIFLDKKKFQVAEETRDTVKMFVLD
jgi:hypothetical protein